MTDNIRNSSVRSLRYSSPEVCVISLHNQHMICQVSPLDGEMREGDDNW